MSSSFFFCKKVNLDISVTLCYSTTTIIKYVIKNSDWKKSNSGYACWIYIHCRDTQG